MKIEIKMWKISIFNNQIEHKNRSKNPIRKKAENPEQK